MMQRLIRMRVERKLTAITKEALDKEIEDASNRLLADVTDA